MNGRTWNPIEFYQAAPRDQADTALLQIEAWRRLATENAGRDVVTRESVRLESHLRHAVVGFGLATELPVRHAGDATGAALARVLAQVMAQAVRGGTPRAVITSQMMMLFNYALDQELAGEIVIQPLEDGTQL